MITKNNYILGDDQILEVKDDRVFHDLFNEHEMDTIEWIVSKILDCNIEKIHDKVRIGNVRLTNNAKDDKQKFVDLVVYYDNYIYNIELNNNFNGNYLRNILYLMNLINNSYIEGDNYIDKEIQGILVNLNWMNNQSYPPKLELTYPYPDIREKYKNEFLVKIININLSNYQNMCYNGSSDKDVFYKLLTRTSKKELKEIVDNEKNLINYYNKMERLSHDKEYCRMVWDERIDRNLRKIDAYRDARNEGYDEGIHEGNMQKQAMIINMYKNNIALETISKISNLSIEEIQTIINENQVN